jgi:predicted glycogen debranching enzyme
MSASLEDGVAPGGGIDMAIDDRAEWLEADGLGGFASGTVSGIRTRRYHALLLSAMTPPTGRVVLVNGFEAWVETAQASCPITTQRYAPDVLHPDGASRIVAFTREPWPTWEFELPGGIRLRQELFVQHGGATMLAWTVIAANAACKLHLRPLISGRDYHATHHENGGFRFEADAIEARVAFRPYDALPSIVALSNGRYQDAPEWYRNFLYREEGERGLDATEDLASPGIFSWRLEKPGDRALWILKAGAATDRERRSAAEVASLYDRARAAEIERRQAFPTPIDRAVDAYLVQRGSGRTIIAGYPWFTDWGRDTFIAIRGLCIASNRLADARDILVEWADAVSEGMLPNRFPDGGDAPEFNSVDASLWYVIAAHELLLATRDDQATVASGHRRVLEGAIRAVVNGYAAGTRFGIRMDGDGLLTAGVPGVQLTWMDARVGERVITPRIGKPVEIQALWLNALAIASRLERRWRAVLERGRAAFSERFFDEDTGGLADVVDVDHVSGTRDLSCRPNQILAIGGLPLRLLDRERARRVVDLVEARLLTPLGLRSLAPGETGYAPRYTGDSSARDAVYHQGTVWPWLMGPFVEAWIRVRGNTAATRHTARMRFLEPLRQHLETAGLGHLSEIADADAPFTPRGCPFQAWSLGEFVRLDRGVLARRQRSSQRRTAEPQWA